MGRVNCGVFWVFSAEQILSLCFPSPWFSNNQPLFLQKNLVFKRNIYLGYVSVVRVAAYQSNTFDKKMYIPGVHPDKDS